MHENRDAYFPLKVLSGYSGVSVRTLRKYLSHPAQPLPYYQVGGKVLIKRSDFDQWISRFRAAKPASLDAVVEEVLRDL